SARSGGPAAVGLGSLGPGGSAWSPQAGPGSGSPGLCWASLLSCLSLACSYVGSLYVWKSHLPRDHPAVIKRRFTSVLVVSSLSPLFVWLWKELMGIKVRVSPDSDPARAELLWPAQPGTLQHL
uniref:Uncharacterized protein n=1 Tax=Sphenodon punctatus TaxID=8508 RepID=A0A8D0GM06_SPHPU